MKLVFDAINFAKKKHANQTRKTSGDPYITHTIAVSYLISAFKPTSKYLEILIAAAILHDTIEDTDTTFEELVKNFGPMVASLVLELTNDPVQIAKVGKLEYQKNKCRGMSSYALVIKLCDRLHNVSDSPSEKMKIDTIELLSHLQKTRKLSNTHKKIVAEIVKLCYNS